MSEEKDRLEINWLNSAGSALAAVSSAVVLSTLGTAGTLIGAAIGSLVITVGGAFYAHSLRMARRRIAAGRTVLVRRDGSRVTTDGDETRSEPAVGPDVRTVVEHDEDAARTSADSRADRWRQVLRELPWKRLLVVSAAVFAVAMAAILAFELATGRPVSYYTGGTSDTDRGTSVPGVGGGGDERQQEQEPGDDEAPQEPREQPEEEPVAPEDEEPTPAEETVAPVPTTAAPAPEETTAP